MGARSLNKRRHDEHLAAPQASFMVAAAANSPLCCNKARRHHPYITVSVLLLGVLFISVAALLFISSNKWRAFGNYVSYEMVNVVNEFLHDPEAFTQGLLYTGNDTLFESTGLYGRSSVQTPEGCSSYRQGTEAYFLNNFACLFSYFVPYVFKLLFIQKNNNW